MGNKHSAATPPPQNSTYTALDTLLLGIFIPLFLLALREVIKLIDFIIHKLSMTLVCTLALHFLPLSLLPCRFYVV